MNKNYRSKMDAEENDDLDRLMMRLESPAVPSSLVPQILAQTVGQSPATAMARQRARAALWAVYGVSFVLVAVCAVLFGQALHATGTLDYLAFAQAEWGLVQDNPTLFRDAVLGQLPWGNCAALLVTLGGWLVATVAVLRAPGLPRSSDEGGAPPHAMPGAVR